MVKKEPPLDDQSNRWELGDRVQILGHGKCPSQKKLAATGSLTMWWAQAAGPRLRWQRRSVQPNNHYKRDDCKGCQAVALCFGAEVAGGHWHSCLARGKWRRQSRSCC